MPAYGEKYGPAQREVLFRLALDEHHGVQGALNALNAGPVDGLDNAARTELAAMNYSYACTLVKAERESRGYVAAARAGLVDKALEQAARLQELADRTIRQLEVKREKSPVDIDAGIRAAKLVREALALARSANDGVNGAKAPAAKPSGGAEQPAKRSTGLAAQIARGSSTEPDDLTPETTQSEAHALAQSSETKEEADVSIASPAREDVALVA